MVESVADQLPELLPRIRRVVAAIAAPGDVDDVTQECCVRMIEREHLWDPARGGVESWGARVARHVALNWRRRRRHQPGAIDPSELSGSPIDTAAAERIRWIVDQFTRLPAKDRELLAFRYREDRTVSEIADQLDISQPAATKRLQGTIAKLKRRARREGWLTALLPLPIAKAVAGAPKIAAGGLLLASGGVASACAFWFTDPDTHLVADTNALPRTRIVAALDTPLDVRMNTVWCASAPLAWSSLKTLVGGDVAVVDGPQWTEALNKSPVTAKDVDAGAFVAGAGRIGDGIIEQLQSRVEQTFRRGRDPVLDQFARSMGPREIVAYAYLAKDLAFPEPYDRLEYGVDFRATDVDAPFRARAFGLKKFKPAKPRHQRIKAQVRIHGYESMEHFALVLATKGAKDDVILVRLPPKKTLHKTVQAATALLAKPAEELTAGDTLAIPVFDYHLTHHYRDLAGKSLANAGFQSPPLAGALQTVRFRMNEHGVKLRSRFAVGKLKQLRVKWLIFGGPFLVLLKEKRAKHPYFAMWVATPEILIPHE